MSTPPKRTQEKLNLLAESSLATALELVRCRNLNIPHSNQTRTLEKNLRVLKDGAAEIERDLSDAELDHRNTPESDVKLREDAFFALSKQIEKIESLAFLGDANGPSSSNSDGDLRKELLSKHPPGFPKGGGSPKYVRFAPLPEPADEDHLSATISGISTTRSALRDLESGQVLQLQQRMLDSQDGHLDVLSDSLRRHREMGLMINDELDAHVTLLQSIDRTVDRTDDRLSRARKRLGQVSKRAKEHGCLCVIVALTIILVFLLVI